MAMKRPPQHRADAKIVYVHPADSSWDEERILREQNEMKKRGEKPSDHPVSRYLGGWTRYDLDAPSTLDGKTVTPREYLDPTRPATEWHLKRLSTQDRCEIENLIDQERNAGSNMPRKAYLRACNMALASVECGPELDGYLGRMTADDFDTLDSMFPGLPLDIGGAAYVASLPLRTTKKKLKP
jgi:hypothetical protein